MDISQENSDSIACMRSWVQSPALRKLGIVVDACNLICTGLVEASDMQGYPVQQQLAPGRIRETQLYPPNLSFSGVQNLTSSPAPEKLWVSNTTI